MKRPLVAPLLLSAAWLAPGCPIYDDDGCHTDSQCAPGYRCQLATGDCVSENPTPECDEPSDCRAGQTCDRYGQCRSVDCSWSDVGCVDGYVCARDDGVWRCVPEGESGGGSAGAASDSNGGAGGVSSAGASGEAGASAGGSERGG